MSNKCIVPNCKSTVGAPFPRDTETKQKWLEGLQLTDSIPKLGSFVCFAHFDPSDIKDALVGTRPSNRLKRGAVPCLLKPAEKDEEGNSILVTEEFEEEKPIIDLENYVEGKAEKLPEVEKICRACMSDQEAETNVFELLEDDTTISSAFMMCVFPVNISKSDNLPKQICKSCLDNLKIAYTFQKKCIQTDDILRAQYTETTHKRKAMDTESDPVSSKRNRTNIEDNDKSEDQLCKITDVGSSDNFEFIEDDKPEDQESHESEDDTIEAVKIKDELSDSELNTPTRRSRRIAKSKAINEENSKSKTSRKGKTKGKIDLDEIEKNLEEIHGQNSAEVDDVEESDSVAETTVETTQEDSSVNAEETTVEDILNTLEEGDMPVQNENALNEFLKNKEGHQVTIIPSLQKKLIVKSKFHIKVNKHLSIKHLKLPKDIKIKPVQQYMSSTGKYPSTARTGVYDSCFLQADSYLFEYGLVKGSVRHLKCIIPTCSAHARQKIADNGEFSDIADVIVPHNHESPNEATRKKQMFLCVMRKKMQTDRTLNIRHIYEDACLEDPDIKQLVPLRNVINEICRHQLTQKMKPINSFEDFYHAIETDPFEKLHFTHNNQQFYQEKFHIEDDGSMAILFGNMEVIQQVSASKIMYVDASFKIDTDEDFKYQLVSVLVWIEDSYYPIMFALVNKKSQLIFRKIFSYLHDELASGLRPQEIITDYEANLYYALAEVYVDSSIGGSVFYYTQNLYKKICSLNLSRDLETNSYFRNIYHMLLMLPLLPVNTINDGLNNIHLEATNFNIQDLALPLFDHVRNQWILNVTPELFCVHKLENRINENVIAPFKKLRDFLLLTKGKLQKTHVTIIHVIEKIIELEAFLRGTYSKPDKKSFGRDLSSFQKKNVLRAWQFIEDHPKIEINNFFSKVLGYIKCMENQLWIWGFYRYDGDTDDTLINASHFSILSPNDEIPEEMEENVGDEEYVEYIDPTDNTIVMDAVIDQDGVLQTGEEMLTSNVVTSTQPQQFETAYIKYVYQ